MTGCRDRRRDGLFVVLVWTGMAAGGCGQDKGAPPTTPLAEAPAEAPAQDPTLRHSERVRALYSRAGLPAPSESATRLPVCEASVAPDGDRWVLGVRCEGPPETTAPSREGTSRCEAHIPLARPDAIPATGEGLAATEARVSLRHVPNDEAARCLGLLASRPDTLTITNLATHLGGLPPLAHWHLEATPPPQLRFAPFGIQLPAPRPAVSAFRPASAGVGVRVAGGLVTTEHPAGDESLAVTSADSGAGTAAALGRRLAGALDDLRTWAGPSEPHRGPSALQVVSELAPGKVVRAAGGAFVGGDPADALPAPDLATVLGHVRDAEPGALVGMLLQHHPLRQDTVAFRATAALVADRLTHAEPTTAFGEVIAAAAANVISLHLIRTRDGDKAARRVRELAVTWPLMGLIEGGEPDLARLESGGEAAELKATRFLDAVVTRLGEEAGRRLLMAVARGEGATPDSLRALARDLAPVPAEVDPVLDTWLFSPDALAKEGPPSLATLVEYVADGGAALIGRLAVDGIASNPALLDAAAGLASGETDALVPVLDLLEAPLTEAAGEDGAAAVGKLLDVGRLVLGGEKARADTAGRLVDELAAELGLEEADRGRLRMLADEVIRALHAERAGPSGSAPLSPAETPP